jgi:hypothetical protein
MKGDRIHAEHQQRVEHRPEEPQDRAAVFQFEVFGDEVLQQFPVLHHRAERPPEGVDFGGAVD